MDDSLEARAKVSDLDKQIAEQKEHIDNMQVNRERELRKRNLNDQLESYRQDVEAKREAEQSKFEALQLELEQEREAIQYHYDELLANERFYADLREDIINGNLSNIQSSLASFLSEFKNANEQTIKDLGLSWQELLNLIGAVESAQGSLGAVKGGTTAPIKTTPPPSSPAPSGGGSGDTSTKYRSYTVQKNDNLSVIAKKMLGDANRWKEIYNLNKSIIGSNPNLIRPGMKFKIPAYHSGSIIGVGTPESRNLFALFGEKLKPNEVYAKLLKNEVVLNPDIAMPQFRDNIADVINGFKPQYVAAGAGSKTINLNVNVAKLNLNDKKQMDTFYRDLQSSVKTLLK